MDLLEDDSGMTTVEYALGTVIVAAIAMTMLIVVKGSWLAERFQGLIQSALSGLG